MLIEDVLLSFKSHVVTSEVSARLGLAQSIPALNSQGAG
jgi:hypothetical protein